MILEENKMYKMHSDYISPLILSSISHQSICYERHAFSVEPDKAVKGTKDIYLLMYFTKGKVFLIMNDLTTAYIPCIKCNTAFYQHLSNHCVIQTIMLFGQNKSQKDKLDTVNLVQKTGEENLSPVLMQANQ